MFVAQSSEGGDGAADDVQGGKNESKHLRLRMFRREGEKSVSMKLW